MVAARLNVINRRWLFVIARIILGNYIQGVRLGGTSWALMVASSAADVIVLRAKNVNIVIA
jgi:hypothetical protein